MSNTHISSFSSDKIGSDLALVLDEYQVWFLKFPTYFIYPAEAGQSCSTEVFQKMDAWLEKSRNMHFSHSSLHQIQAVHSEFKIKTQRYFSDFFENDKTPSYDNYIELVSLFEEFIVLIRRMEEERRLNQSPASLPDLQYLRPLEFLETDLSRELARLSRNGKPFCLAYARLVSAEDSSKKRGFLDDPEVLKTVSTILHDVLRSYDDTYKISKDDFVLSLKQIGTYDALSTMERLAKAIEGYGDEFVTRDGKHFKISLSYHVLQQSPHETAEEILKILRENLENHIGGDRRIFSYKEISSLQKFIQKHALDED